MKRSTRKFLVIIMATVCFVSLKGQDDPTPQFTQDGIFDTLYDRFGNKYNLANLSTSSRKLGGPYLTMSTTPTNVCQAGKFTLYFEPGSYLDVTPAAQTVVCQVFTDYSNFISSTLTTQINVYCGQTTVALGTGTGFYLFPPGASNAQQGLIENQVQRSLISGVDSYSFIPFNSYYSSGGAGFYSGAITIDGNYNWNTSISPTIAPTEYDLYSVVLHEATHMLGFVTLLNSSGGSQFGANNIFYSTYDQFLATQSGSYLITPLTPSCSMANYSFQVNPSLIAPGSCSTFTPDYTDCTDGILYSSPSTTATVYTPDCWEPGSSLSHAEDMCSWAPGFTTTCVPNHSIGFNNLFYVMTNAQIAGNCYNKRFLREHERYVLCDIGYSVAATYSIGTVAINTYTGGACSGTDVWGINDGFANGAFTYTTALSSISIPTAGIVSNDASGVNISCLEVLYNNATFSVSGGSLHVNSSPNQGLVILKYYPTKSGNVGNVTYIFIYFYPGQCNAANDCNFVQNGGFENLAAGAACGPYVGTNPPFSYLPYSLLDCWQNYVGTPDLFTRSCTVNASVLGGFNLGTETYSMNPACDSYNGAGNDRVINLIYNGSSEVIKNKLSSPLVPGNTYQVSMLVRNFSGSVHGTLTSNPSKSPVVITVASLPSFSIQGAAFPSGMDILAEFTVPVVPGSGWTSVTGTINFNPSVPASHEVIVLGPDAQKTFSLAGTSGVYIQFDEISILPYPTAETFSIPTSSMSCGVFSFTNLGQYASTPTGTFTGAGITFANNEYHFNVQNTLPAGVYPIAFTYSSQTCISTIWQNVIVSPSFSLTTTVSQTHIPCSQLGGTVGISVYVSPQALMSYTWLPGNLTGTAVTMAPSVSTIYTVIASDVNNCTASETRAISVSTNCCNNPAIPEQTVQTVTGAPVYPGPMRFTSSFTLQSGAALYLNGEFLVSPDVSITVSSGAQLNLWGAHLYACTDMWEGIVVQDGGKVVMLDFQGSGNLIEDAKTAISVAAYTSTTPVILDIKNTIFNKNRVSIDILGYPHSTTDAFKIKSTVFTCRDYTFTGTQWPQPGTGAGGLHSFTSPTPALASPFLMNGAPIVNLKNPHNTVRSHAAIKLTNVGVTTGTTFPLNFDGPILTPTSTADFLLFDGHEYFIRAVNSNVKLSNSVFQNTQSFSVSSTATVGAAIDYSCSVINSYTPGAAMALFELDLSPASPDEGNKFYDCHRGVFGSNAFSFKLEYATIRSTHHATTATTPGSVTMPGQSGVYMKTNQVEDYIIDNNVFSNVVDGVAISLYPDNIMRPGLPYVVGPPQYFMVNAYIHTLSIIGNTFSPEDNITFSGTTDGHVTNPVTVQSHITAMVANGCNCNGLHIEDNEIYRCRNGITLDAVNPYTITCKSLGLRKIIRSNMIVLEENSGEQHGISYINSKSEPVTFGERLQLVQNNTITVYGTPSQMNSKSSLYYGFNNGGVGSLFPAPHILCNVTENANVGFRFVGPNAPANWKGNKMEDLEIGMMLDNGGVIGQQGDANNPIDNEWKNWPGGNWGTWVGTLSIAQSSPLYMKTYTPFAIPTSSGIVGPGLVYGAPLTTFTANGSYHCSSGGTSTIIINNPLPDAVNYESAEVLYIANTSAYRYLALNDSMKNAEPALLDFFENLQGSSIDLFMQIEMHISKREFEEASDILDAINTATFHEVEDNYFNFYSLSLKYKTQPMNFSEADMSSLNALAALCSGTSGGAIHQARALYQFISGRVFNGYSDCGTSGDRKARQEDKIEVNGTHQWDLRLFPNPSADRLLIESTQEIDQLTVVIRDLAGRIVFSKDAVTINFRTEFELELPNGAYLITINSLNNGIVTKMLLINK